MSDMGELRFVEASHEYFVRGQRIPSVTQLLAPLYAETFAGIPQHILDAKAAIGTAVHLATELYDCDDLDEASLHPIVRGYLDGWKRFRDHHQVATFLATEQRRYHPTLHYAGTVDRELMFEGRRTTLDIKTTVELYPAVGVQLAGYAMLADPVDHAQLGRVALQLTQDGQYHIHRHRDPMDAACFLSLLTLHNWKEKNQ